MAHLVAMTIGKLLDHDELAQSSIGLPEMDPLREEGALVEAQLVSMIFDNMRSRAALLFDLRTALAFREGNVAVLIARGVLRLEWEQEGRYARPTAWNVVQSSAERHNDSLLLALGFTPDARTILSAKYADFHVGAVSSLPSAPPDFTAEDDESVIKGMPTWDSHFQLLQSSRLRAV